MLTESDLLALLDDLLQRISEPSEGLKRAEVAMANPLVQNLMKALSDIGI